jgi:hypothetical protein
MPSGLIIFSSYLLTRATCRTDRCPAFSKGESQSSLTATYSLRLPVEPSARSSYIMTARQPPLKVKTPLTNPDHGPLPPIHPPKPRRLHIKKFTKQFDKVYDQFYGEKEVNEALKQQVTDTDIDMDLFDKLTLGKRYQHYIALIDGRIRFDETPNAPHGQIQYYLNLVIGNAVGAGTRGALMHGSADNGTNFHAPWLQ